jgi:hypothetical protein
MIRWESLFGRREARTREALHESTMPAQKSFNQKLAGR